jgi:DtxR family Mn-dependent transcriptional regulator
MGVSNQRRSRALGNKALKVELKYLSLRKQNYIETVFELSKLKGFARRKEIAKKLNVKMPSVTEMLNNLSELSLIRQEKRGKVFLTATGSAIACELERRQSVLVQLFKYIGCSITHSEKIACKIEHDIDRETINRLELLMISLENKELSF